jgi:hypothetical protein
MTVRNSNQDKKTFSSDSARFRLRSCPVEKKYALSGIACQASTQTEVESGKTSVPVFAL